MWHIFEFQTAFFEGIIRDSDWVIKKSEYQAIPDLEKIISPPRFAFNNLTTRKKKNIGHVQ